MKSMTPFFTRLALAFSIIALLLAIAASGLGTLLPRGTWIPMIFSRPEGPPDHLVYLVDTLTHLLAYVLDGPDVASPILSPDARTIAYLDDAGNDQMGAHTALKWAAIPVNGVVELTQDVNLGWPAWSPDGTQIAFSSKSTNQNIKVISLQDARTRRMTENPADDEAPAWSPDGDWIAYDRLSASSAVNLVLIDARCPADCDLEALPLTDNNTDYSPAWSPDGRQLAFLSGQDIFLLDMTCLNRNTLCNQQTPVLLLQSTSFIVWMIWSDDGQQIFFESQVGRSPVLNVVSAACRGERTCQPVPLLVLNPPPGLRW